MGMAVSQVFACFEPCFYARSIVRMAVRNFIAYLGNFIA